MLPYANRNEIVTLAYGALCRGLLAGKMTAERNFPATICARSDPKFQPPRFGQYLKAVAALDRFAQTNYGKRVVHLALALDPRQAGRRLCLVGRAQAGTTRPGRSGLWLAARRRGHGGDRSHPRGTIESPVGPEFMAPPEQRRGLEEALRIDVDLEPHIAARLRRGGEPLPQIGRQIEAARRLHQNTESDGGRAPPRSAPRPGPSTRTFSSLGAAEASVRP